jgi:hypothetical protein
MGKDEIRQAMKPPPPLQTFTYKMKSSPPGTKRKQKLPRGYEQFEEPSNRRWYWLIAGAATGALVIGMLVGRFLLP